MGTILVVYLEIYKLLVSLVPPAIYAVAVRIGNSTEKKERKKSSINAYEKQKKAFSMETVLLRMLLCFSGEREQRLNY